MSTIEVEADRHYPVLVGAGVSRQAGDYLPQGAAQVLLVHPAPLSAAAEQLAQQVRSTGRQVVAFEVPDGEAAKDLGVIAGGWDLLGQHAFARSDVVIAFGGGAVTDAAGFIAATWLRGVEVIQVPTTLLAMVDAAVGGKTGINTAAGKNLVGSFHSPRAVLCDLETLATLPAADLRAGLAEVIKCGFIADPQILDLVQGEPAAALDPESLELAELVHRSISVKAQVVSADLREADQREILNYGHTLAHAIENAESYRWRHGDAVAVGMVFAAEVAHRSGYLSATDLDLHRAVLHAVGLPTSYTGAPWDRLLSAMRRDKKSRAGTLRLVVLEGIGRPVRLSGPDPQVLAESFGAVSTGAT